MIKLAFILFCFLGNFLFSQDWRGLGSEPGGHNPKFCQRCISNTKGFQVAQKLTPKKTLVDYWTSQDDLSYDFITYKDSDKYIKKVPVKDLSTLEFPNKIILKDGSSFDFASVGIVSDESISVEKILRPTPNQAITKKLFLKLSQLSEESKNSLKKYWGKFKIGKHQANAFVIEVDQSKSLFTLRLGKDGFIKTMSYSSLTSGQKHIDELHSDRFLNLKLAGLNFLEAKFNAYKKLHISNPIDYENELSKQRKSEEDARSIAIQNEALKKQHVSLQALALKSGLGYSSVPPLELIEHKPYYAHPKWSEIADVYKSTANFLKDIIVNWNQKCFSLPSSGLKLSNESSHELKKRKSLGSETIEGFYKIKTPGEFKLYLHPDGVGRCVIQKAKPYYRRNGDVDGYYRSHYESEFSYDLIKSPDQSFDIVSIKNEKITISNADIRRISGSRLNDYSFKSKQGKLMAQTRSGQSIKVERIRHWIIELDFPNKIVRD